MNSFSNEINTNDTIDTTITLQTVHLSKSFLSRRKKKEVLKDITFQAHSSECIGILGANGCGKSTLLSILAGIQTPDSGQLHVANCSESFLSKETSRKHKINTIGYIPQECPLMEELNALDNLRLWYCDSTLNLNNELENGFLGMLGIPEFLHVPVNQMSGGMKKRLSIGCAIAENPNILLLDEPGAALDLICKERIEIYLKNYKKQGNTIIIATHEEREIAMCDTLYILKDGTLSPFSFDGDIHRLASKL